MSFNYNQDEDAHIVNQAIAGDFTVMFWIRFTAVNQTYRSIWWMGDGGVYDGAIYEQGILIVTGTDPDTIEIWARSSSGARLITANASLNTTGPIHVALVGGTANGAAGELFLNGVSAGTFTNGNGPQAYLQQQVMWGNDRQLDGTDPDTNLTNASIAYGIMYDRRLSVEEIRANMFDFLHGAASSWGAWSLLDDNGLVDVSGNGRNLTALGTPVVTTIAFPGVYDGFYGYGWPLAGDAAGGGGPQTFFQTGTFSGVGSLAVARALGLSFGGSFTGTGSSDHIKRVSKSFGFTASGNLTLTKRIAMAISFAATGTADIAKRIAKAFSFAATGTLLTLVQLVLLITQPFAATGTAGSSQTFIEFVASATRRVARRLIGMIRR